MNPGVQHQQGAEQSGKHRGHMDTITKREPAMARNVTKSRLKYKQQNTNKKYRKNRSIE